jgi:S-adenosyl-L-methionine hydrolase (adenosine-forming)
MPLITLLTDFGTSDHFVGVMKGVIHGIYPGAQIVDISHDVTPYQIAEAGFLLAQSWRYFPKATIHVTVVDPGVGSSRRPVLVEAGGHYFVAPDNGLLSMVYDEDGDYEARHITAEQYFLHPVSQTFHGRDIFSPVAAHLAAGVAAACFGPRLQDPVRLPFAAPFSLGPGRWQGTVLKVDHFGNVITNFKAEQFPQVREQPFEIRIGNQVVQRLETSYATGGRNQLFLIASSSGYLEVAAGEASAAELVGCAVGDPVDLTLM